MIEGRELHIYTDHKPLIFVFQQQLHKASPRPVSHLQFISEFTTDIRHVTGKHNISADWLSRINAISTIPRIDYMSLAHDQQIDPELQELLQSNQENVQ